MNKYFLGGLISVAVAVWGGFSVSSSFADKHHLNGASVVLCVIGILGAVYFGWRLNQTIGGGKEQR